MSLKKIAIAADLAKSLASESTVKPRTTRFSAPLALALLFAAAGASASCVSRPDSTNLYLVKSEVAAPPSTAPAWQAEQIYLINSLVSVNGLEYQARWWTQNNAPGSDAGEVWKLTVPANGLPQAWQANQVYYAGEQTRYNDAIYTARWWTKGALPDSEEWSFERPISPLARVKLAGRTGGYNCAYRPYPFELRTQGHYYLNWHITEDPDNEFAYWKVRETPLDGVATTMVGREREASVSANWQETTIIYPDRSQHSTGSGSYKTAYLCNAKDECREIRGGM
jgi:chitodextrinase